MLWIKALHIVFVTSWFSALFYLPRIFVNLAQVESTHSAEYQRLLGMATRLMRFGSILMFAALGLGAWLWLGYGLGSGQPWFYAKLVVVVITLGYGLVCRALLRTFIHQSNTRSHIWFRWFNEVPVVLLLMAVVLVVVKPAWG